MIPFVQAILGDMISLAAVGAIVAGIAKLFQMGTTLNEIKDLLVEIKRNSVDLGRSAPVPAAYSQPPQSPEALVRALHADPAAVQAALYDSDR